MLTTVLMCQQGIPFRVSPARTQMMEEFIKRNSEVVIFFPGHIVDETVRSKARKLVNTKRMQKEEIRREIKRLNPDVVICFTEEDTKVCFPLPYQMKGTYFYYYNLEIYVKSIKEKQSRDSQVTIKLDYLQNKLKEALYVKGCSALVIQDDLRKKVLKKYWISHPCTWLIPNSYYQNRNKYDMPHKDGLIYSGTVTPDVLGSFLEHVKCLDGIELTLSGWNRAKLKIPEGLNIKIIRQNLSQEEYTKFVSAYDIALVWYTGQDDDNVYNIGLASGKFFKHLSLGQPVIVNNVPGLADEVSRNKLGIVINDLSELQDAVRTIRGNYEFYVKNIKRVYWEKYDYGKASKKFFDAVVHKAQIAADRRMSK